MRAVDPSRSRIVLIGTSTYVHCDAQGNRLLPDLPAVVNNLSDLYAFFTDPGLGGFPAENCALVPDGASLAEVGGRLLEAAAAAEDLLLIYYAGHGLLGERFGLYLGLAGSRPDGLQFTALDYASVRDACQGSRARNRVVIIDSCFSGRAVDQPMAAGDDRVLGQLEVRGTYLLTSAPGNEVALSREGERHTAFTGRLLELLRTGSPEAGAYLSPEDIYRGMLRRLQSEGLPLPRRSGTDRIDLLGLVRNHDPDRAAEPDADADTAADPALAPAHDELMQEVRHRLGSAEEAAGQGRHAEAARLFGEAIPVMERRLAREHPQTLAARRRLAFHVGESGESTRARTLFGELRQVFERVFGPEHPETLAVRRHLAYYSAAAGSRAQAIRELRALVPLSLRHLGSDHPETLTGRRQLAEFVGENGNRAEAVRMLRALLADLARLRDGQDAETIAVRRLIARNVGEGADGDPAKAAELLGAVAADAETVHGPQDPRTFAVRRLRLHYLSRVQGRTEAEQKDTAELVRHLHAEVERTLGPGHPEAAALAAMAPRPGLPQSGLPRSGPTRPAP